MSDTNNKAPATGATGAGHQPSIDLTAIYPIIGTTTADTLNNVRSVLALLEATADTIATTRLNEDAAAGLTLILGMVGDAVKAVQAGIPPTDGRLALSPHFGRAS